MTAGRGTSLLVDARGLRKSGIGRYLRAVLDRALADGRFGRVVLLGDPDELRAYLATRAPVASVEIVPLASRFYSSAVQLRWAALAARGRLDADVAFFPHYDVPLPRLPAPAVVAVQDLAHFRLPGLFPTWKRVAASLVMRRAVARASRILVSSRSVHDDLLARHPEADGRVVRIPLGVDPAFAAPAGDEATARAAALRPYLLCVGNRKPHKNVRFAVDVLARLRERFPALKLVVAGSRFDGDGVAERADALGVAPAVVERCDVGEEELRALYAEAECLLFPSLHEGFGLPPLEAMAAGAPVVASDRTAVPETVGDAGDLLSPDDVEEWAAAVERLLADPAHRAERVRRGRARAAELDLRATAARTVDEIARAASAPRPRPRRVPTAPPRPRGGSPAPRMRGNRLWRRLDAWVGRSAIAGLSLVPGRGAEPPAEPRRILVVKLSAIGDMVLLVPALRALRSRYPTARIEMVGTSLSRGVAEELGAYLDGFHALEPGRVVRDPTYPLRFAAELRRRRFEVAVDFEQWTHFAAVLLRLAGVPTRIGFRTPAPLRDRLYTHTRPRLAGSHEAANFLRLLEPLGIRSASMQPELPVRDEAVRGVRRMLAAAGWDGAAPLVVVHPGCGHAYPRAWPLERYRELCTRLAAERDPFFVFTGVGEEAELTRALAADRPERAWAPDRLPLRDVIALCSLADLVVSGNTGIMHVAAALRRPQVVAEGPNDPAHWGPINPNALVVRSSCPDCPCLDFGWEFHRTDGFCMEQVPVAAMHEAARRLLGRADGARRVAAGGGAAVHSL